MSITDRRTGLLTGTPIKPPCAVASTANLTLSSTQVVDGVAVGNGERVLVKDQTDASENGIWVSNSSTWTRATDFDGSGDAIPGTIVYVARGSLKPQTFWAVNTTSTATSLSIGSADQTWTQFSSSGLDVSITVTAFMETLLDDATAAAGRATLGAVGSTVSNTFESSNTFTADALFNTARITQQYDDSDAAQGPVHSLYRNSTSPVLGDVIGAILLEGNDAGQNRTIYADILGRIIASSSGAESSQVDIRAKNAGTAHSMSYKQGALILPSVTGGGQGVGTVNATAVYDDGNQIHVLQDGLDTATDATNSGANDLTTIDKTSIRSDARRITIFYNQLSVTGTDRIVIVLGDSEGFETSGYVGETNAVSWSTDIDVGGDATPAATDSLNGRVVLDLMDTATNTWVADVATFEGNAGAENFGVGRKALSGALTQVRITVSGTDTFDAGTVNFLVE